ncbi:MAG: dockerin type I domain-containing protein [Ruminococcus sp.]
MRRQMLKKGVTVSLALLTLIQGMGPIPTAHTYAEEEKVFYYGDLDGDEHLTVFDLSLMKQGYVNPDSLTDLQKAVCDVSSNGEFDMEDIRLMQDYLLARINAFPSGSIYTPPKTEPEEPPYNGQKTLTGNRMYEYLDRGTYAVSAGNAVFVSWRLLASDEPDIGFNVYRTTDGVTAKLNSEVLTGGTNYTDTTADMTKNNTYYVTTVYNGVETPIDGEFTLKAGSSVAGDKNNAGAAQIIPIK